MAGDRKVMIISNFTRIYPSILSKQEIGGGGYYAISFLTVFVLSDGSSGVHIKHSVAMHQQQLPTSGPMYDIAY